MIYAVIGLYCGGAVLLVSLWVVAVILREHGKDIKQLLDSTETGSPLVTPEDLEREQRDKRRAEPYSIAAVALRRMADNKPARYCEAAQRDALKCLAEMADALRAGV